jgi:hypothetical protein
MGYYVNFKKIKPPFSGNNFLKNGLNRAFL